MKRLITYIQTIFEHSTIFNLSLILLIAGFLLFLPIDPDLFWHLRLGELTWSEGPLHSNSLSYTFQEFGFIDYEWLSHVIMRGVFSVWNYWGLFFLYAVVIVAAFFLSVSTRLSAPANNQAKLLAVLIGLVASAAIIGIRPQMATWLGAIAIYYLVIDFYKHRSRKVWFIPLIFFIWANLHGGFLVGFTLLGAVVAGEIIKLALRFTQLADVTDIFGNLEWKEIKKLVLVSLISLAVTFINPYFYKLHYWAFVNAFDSYASSVIIEWLSPNFHQILGKLFFGYAAVVIVALYKRRNIGLTELLILIGFGIMSLQSVRHIPLFVLISIPSILAYRPWGEMSFDKSRGWAVLNALILLIAVSSFSLKVIQHVQVMSSTELIYQAGNFPYSAVKFLRKSDLQGNMFNAYNWGGFLVWEYPEKKVFINGLMASWRMDGVSILQEYRETSTLQNKEWKQKLNDYNIGFIFLSLKEPLANALRYDSEWEIIYEDELAVIYQRKEFMIE